MRRAYAASSHVFERFAFEVLGQHRSTQRKLPRGQTDEDALTRSLIALDSEYGGYGYRRIWALLREQGWNISVSRVERIGRRATDRSELDWWLGGPRVEPMRWQYSRIPSEAG